MREKAPKDVVKRTLLLNTFFFSKLRSVWEEGHEGLEYYGKVKKWVQKLDLFSKDFIIIPVNERSHWYLIIVCFAGNVVNKVKSEPNSVLDSILGPAMSLLSTSASCVPQNRTPRILIFDSLNINRLDPKKEGANKRAKITKKLRIVLQELWREKHHDLKTFEHQDIPDIQLSPPKQPNSWDCGIYLLKYVDKFLEDPEFILDRTPRDKNISDWFNKNRMNSMRKQILTLISKIGKQIADGNLDNVGIEINEDIKGDEEMTEDANFIDDDVVVGGGSMSYEVVSTNGTNSESNYLIKRNDVENLLEDVVSEVVNSTPPTAQSPIMVDDTPSNSVNSTPAKEVHPIVDDLMSDDESISEEPIPRKKSNASVKCFARSLSPGDKRVKQLQNQYEAEVIDIENGEESEDCDEVVSPKRSHVSTAAEEVSEDELTACLVDKKVSPFKKSKKTEQ